MQPRELVWTGGAVLLLALSALGAQQEPRADFEGAALLEPAKAALEVPLDKRSKLRLIEMLARFQEVTDWTVTMDEETRRLIGRYGPFCSGPLRAEPARVLPAVEAVLAHSKLVLSVVREEPPRVLSLRSLDTAARTSVRQDAIYVPIEEVPRFEDHRAVLIETVLPLPNLDVRQIANDLRALVVDRNVLQLMQVADSPLLLIQGLGHNVADLVTMLRQADAWASTAGRGSIPTSRPPAVLEAGAEALLSGGSDGGTTLLELVLRYAEEVPGTLLLSDETTRLLRHTRVGFETATPVPGADLTTLVEQLLRQNKFIVTELLSDEPVLFAVQSLDTTARSGARQDARYVDAGSVQACAARPATIFQTVIELPHTEVSALKGPLRNMLVDPFVQQAFGVGYSSSVILQGLGAELARIAAMLERVDANEAARPKPSAPQGAEGEER